MPQKPDSTQYMTAVPAVEQTIAILNYLISFPRYKANLTEIAKGVGIYKSKAQAILGTLQKYGWVSKGIENRYYSLGFAMIPFGQRALENIDYQDLVKPFLVKLARETSCTAQFCIISNEDLIVVAVEESGGLLDTRFKVGYKHPLYERAHGKILLAFLPDDERERLLAKRKYKPDGKSSDLDLDQLRQEIRELQRKGFAVDFHTSNPAIKVMASPVLGTTNYPIGMFFIVGILPKSAAPKFGVRLWEISKQFSVLLKSSALSNEVFVRRSF